MRNRILYYMVLVFLTACTAAEKNEMNMSENIHLAEYKPLPGSHEISFTTSDSITVFGDLAVESKSQPTLLMFHQGSSNARAEYENIAPRLRDRGFNILAIDQRQGGQYFYGGFNRTKLHLDPHQDAGYCDTYPDIAGALDYLINNNFSGPIIVWGSSYSGSLGIQLAAKNQENISGVLAFSPASGDPMEGCKPDPYFEQLDIPLLVLRPSSEFQLESVKAQFELVEKHGHQTYVAENGMHGSSMLDNTRVDGSVEENWNTVLSFLENVLQ